MLRFYTPIFILQIYCLYLAYKADSTQKWFWIILFLPLIGCLFYLYFYFFQRVNIDNITETAKETAKESVPNKYNIEKLEEQIQFSGTATNKIILADEYTVLNRHPEALKLYQSCLNGVYDDDPVLLRKLVQSYFSNEDFANTIKFGEQLEKESSFKNSEERIAYAWASFFENKKEKAEQLFQDMNLRFTNYRHRIEYSKFLLKTDRKNDAINKLEALLDEIAHMGRPEQRMKRPFKIEINNLLSELKLK